MPNPRGITLFAALSRKATAWPMVTPGASAAFSVAALSWFIWVKAIGRTSVMHVDQVR